jgi:hypothetical protein
VQAGIAALEITVPEIEDLDPGADGRFKDRDGG